MSDDSLERWHSAITRVTTVALALFVAPSLFVSGSLWGLLWIWGAYYPGFGFYPFYEDGWRYVVFTLAVLAAIGLLFSARNLTRSKPALWAAALTLLVATSISMYDTAINLLSGGIFLPTVTIVVFAALALSLRAVRLRPWPFPVPAMPPAAMPPSTAQPMAAGSPEFEIRQKTSVLLTIFAALAWLGVLAVLFVGFAGLTTASPGSSNPNGFFIIALLAIYFAIYAAILSFLRTKGDISVNLVRVFSTSGAQITLRRDTSFWISLLMGITGVGCLVAVGAFFYGESGAAYSFGQFTAVISLVVAVILLLYLLVLDFLRKKLVLEGPSPSDIIQGGRTFRLTRDTSIWITLGMIISLLFSLYLVILLAQPLGTLISDYQNYSNYSFYQTVLVNDTFQVMPVLFGFLISLIQVFVLEFLRTKVNVEVVSSGGAR